MADDFTSEKFAWLDQVAGDGALPSHAARLAVVFLRYVNRATGDAWPAIPTLASALGMVENSVRNALRAMVANGHLAIEAGGGRGATNRYRWIIKSTDQAKKAPIKPCKAVKGNGKDKPCTDLKGNGTTKPCTDLQGFETETLHGGALNPAQPCAKPCTVVHPNPLKNTFEEPIERISADLFQIAEKKLPAKKGKSARTKIDLAGDFEAFWRAYPRHDDKPDAFKAWKAAIKAGGDADAIIAGAERYAAERATENPKYTKYAATYLRKGSWANEPAASPLTGYGASAHLQNAIRDHDYD